LSNSARSALKQLATVEDGEVRASALGLGRLLKLESSAERMARLDRSVREVGDVKLPVDQRLVAVRGLAAENDAVIAARLLGVYPTGTPAVRKAILRAAFSRRDHLPAVVAALRKKKLPVAALNAIQRTALLEHSDTALRRSAAELLRKHKTVDEKTLQRFLAALQKPRDVIHGGKVFREHCATCHRAHGIGVGVGADLAAEFRRAEETIVRDILAPSEAIAAGYETYVIETTDGRVLSGLLTAEAANSVTLSLAGGQRLTVLRKEIKALKSLPISLMPEALAQVLQPRDVADVIAWLRWPSSRRVLFDDDPTFVKLLADGGGGARLVTGDKHSGVAALRITPPQKYSPRIAGWAFRIRENPRSGEYRYLRLAWKTAGAQGVMIELADNGRWPVANKPTRRYYSGKNTTVWQATKVSDRAPAEWTVIKRDLWKDFGNFTLTGIAPTAMGGPVLFDRVELLRTIEK
jgi:putative heme-binding domain-containing protein